MTVALATVSIAACAASSMPPDQAGSRWIDESPTVPPVSAVPAAPGVMNSDGSRVELFAWDPRY